MLKYYNVTVNGTMYKVGIEEADGEAPSEISAEVKAPPKKKETVKVQGPGTAVKAPMQGTVLKIAVKKGDSVKKGDLVCLLEAMKMENEIFAPCDGTVTSVVAESGQSVATGAVIATIG